MKTERLGLPFLKALMNSSTPKTKQNNVHTWDLFLNSSLNHGLKIPAAGSTSSASEPESPCRNTMLNRPVHQFSFGYSQELLQTASYDRILCWQRLWPTTASFRPRAYVATKPYCRAAKRVYPAGILQS